MEQRSVSQRCRSGNSSHASSKATSGAFVARLCGLLLPLRPTAVLQACTFTLQTVSPLKFLQLAGVPLLLLDALFCFCLSDDWFIVHSWFSVIECEKRARPRMFHARVCDGFEEIDPVHRINSINTSVLDLRRLRWYGNIWATLPPMH